jgi:ribosome-associated heat shock protein Hsp15
MSKLESAEDGLRLDKWLFQARLFKTRTVAAELAARGRIRVNRTPVGKSHFRVRPGDVLTFAQGRTVRVIRVLGLPTRRGPADEARSFYEELSTV